jgi:hypothetical protein
MHSGECRAQAVRADPSSCWGSTMRTVWAWGAGGAVWLLLLAAGRAGAQEDVQAQLERMNGRIGELENQLTATRDELSDANRRVASQQEVIRRAGLVDAEGKPNLLSRLFSETEVGGWVTASYWWNTQRPANAFRDASGNTVLVLPNTGTQHTTALFHPNQNSFQVDQVWLSVFDPPTPEGPGGAAVDLVWGLTADILNGNVTADQWSSGSEPNLFQANVQYRAPFGEGIYFTAGLFEKFVGTENTQQTENFNMTRGLLFVNLQPRHHLGVTVESSWGPASLMLGVANDSTRNFNVDFDASKAFLWSIGLEASPTIEMRLGGLVGSDALPRNPNNPFADNDYLGLVDFITRWEPSDRLKAWLDFDFAWSENDGRFGSPWALGVAAAAWYEVAPRTGFSVRGEYLYSRHGFVLDLSSGLIPPSANQTLWSLTGTLDHWLTDNLQVRAELRYDRASTTLVANDLFFLTEGSDPPNSCPVCSDEQILLGLETTYRF